MSVTYSGYYRNIFQIHKEDVQKRDVLERKLSHESKKGDDLKKVLKQVNDKLDETEKVISIFSEYAQST